MDLKHNQAAHSCIMCWESGLKASELHFCYNASDEPEEKTLALIPDTALFEKGRFVLGKMWNRFFSSSHDQKKKKKKKEKPALSLKINKYIDS